jgi:rhodanese-related sulfurtransferase
MRHPDPTDGEGEDLFRTEHASSAEAAEAVAERLRAGEDPPATVDVREADAYREVHVEGAYHLPLDHVEEAAERLPEDELLYVYGEDHASATASRVTLLLAQEGLRVQEVHGGLEALREAGAPLAEGSLEAGG